MDNPKFQQENTTPSPIITDDTCIICYKESNYLDEGICYNCLQRQKLLSDKPGLPKFYKLKTFDNYVIANDKQQKMIDVSKEFILGTNTKGLYLSGTVGIGKTHLASAVWNELWKYIIQDNYSEAETKIRFTSFTDILLEIRASYDNKNIQEIDIIDSYITPTYLIIDDIGSEKISPFTISTLYNIIDNRYREAKHKVFITSNINLQQLAEITNERIASRIAEMCDIYNFTGQDYRVGKK